MTCLKEVIKDLHIAFEKDDVTLKEIKYIMNRYKSDRNDWDEFATFSPKTLG